MTITYNDSKLCISISIQIIDIKSITATEISGIGGNVYHVVFFGTDRSGRRKRIQRKCENIKFKNIDMEKSEGSFATDHIYYTQSWESGIYINYYKLKGE